MSVQDYRRVKKVRPLIGITPLIEFSPYPSTKYTRRDKIVAMAMVTIGVVMVLAEIIL